MAKSTKQNYTLDPKKKIITATISELDEVEKEIVQMYINAGYILHKGKTSKWTKKYIIDWLKKYVSEQESEDFKKKLDANWTDGRSQFFDKYPTEKREKLENAVKNNVIGVELEEKKSK